jgi:hypothetical protein
MMATLEASPIANHRMSSGSSAIFATGNKAEMNGSPVDCRQQRDQAAQHPPAACRSIRQWRRTHPRQARSIRRKVCRQSGGTQGSNHMAGWAQTRDLPDLRLSRAGLVIDRDKVYDDAKLTGEPDYASVLGILADWRAARGAPKKAAAAAGKPGEAAALARTCSRRCAVAVGHLLRRRQLCRSRRGNGPPHERPMGLDPHQGLKAWHFIKASRASPTRRNGEDFGRLRPGGLGG